VLAGEVGLQWLLLRAELYNAGMTNDEEKPNPYESPRSPNPVQKQSVIVDIPGMWAVRWFIGIVSLISVVSLISEVIVLLCRSVRM
jgi:hypothetical protein